MALLFVEVDVMNAFLLHHVRGHYLLPVDWLTGFVVKGQEVTGLPTLLVSAMCILLRWGLDT